MTMTTPLQSDRYRVPELLELPLGNGFHLVYSRGRRTTHVLPAAEARLLSTCTVFRSLSDHARALAARGAPDPRALIEKSLALGLLVSHGQVLDRVARVPGDGVGA